MKLTFEDIKKKSLELGFDDVGITDAEISEDDINSYNEWIQNKYHGSLKYMENNIRCFPKDLFPGAKTVLIFITFYKQPPVEKKEYLIASYARGKDYHHLHRKRLKRFIHWLESITQQKNIAKGFSDSTPILEKALAVKAGLGWFGKNTLLIHRRFGTYTLLSGIVTSLNIPFEKTPNLRLPKCGVCQKCLDACPTKAFISPYLLDATKCLSYHTIESKEEIPDFVKQANPGYIFGCDICQEVCPHNVRPPLSLQEHFKEENGVGKTITLEKLIELEANPTKLFGTPLQRRGVTGLRKTYQSLKSEKSFSNSP